MAVLKKLLMILILALGYHSLLGQVHFSLEANSSYDDNLYRSPVPLSDVYSNFSISLSYSPEKSGMTYFMNSDFLVYQKVNERDFSIHSLGFSYYSPFGDDEQHAFYAGGNGSLRLDSDEYNYYDYTQIFLYSNIRYDFDYLFLKAGYNFRYRNYDNLPALTNSRHYLFAQINKSFASRTTVILETDLGYKSFQQQEYSSSYYTGGYGRGMSGGSTSLTTQTETSEVPPAGQFVFLARISQSLHERAGIYFQFRRQMRLNDQSGLSNADGYFQDEEIFDDPFGYESKDYSSQFTWFLPWDIKFQAGGGYTTKNYISEQAYLSAEDTIGSGGSRYDEQNSLYFDFTKTFYTQKSWLSALKLSVYYNMIRNKSNSYWYDYKNAVIGLGFQWQI